MPLPNTPWLTSDRRQFRTGVDVFEAAKPAPMACCMTNSGATAVAVPTQQRAGRNLGLFVQCDAAERHQETGERHPHRVVSQPAQHPFSLDRRCARDGVVCPFAAEHVPDPAADEAQMECLDLDPLQQQEPNVHHSGCADANERDPDQVFKQHGHGGSPTED